jgi:hypothetical protein
MDPLATEPLDDLLPEPPHANAVAGQGRLAWATPMMLRFRGVGVEPEQEVGRRQVEEAERVGLDDLGEVHHPAQIRPGRRRVDSEDLVRRPSRTRSGG